ncbi:guanylate-binding protein 6-like isoform X1 [Dasypus novemcinctus]|uniref:guanylate-binding protein 6-like isoform X1 n=1 Tax=Dasypus novemcinctus TaxID=9361 RepID=UPI00265DEDEE|nr:guanylate-binding protein 6-like isoform X1 [Dasypus novemcinctus]XP_058159188.1 guanylate-binding protein 6-like isoform X1 [Dasypus novemcinctus]XP_058159189.1 guanylate-binding protein 6-like isoform X1 [Dasypus novemcinctus]
MASGPTMLVPLCLVKNKKGQLSVNQKALRILDKISQPVVVVAIVGLNHTGKSYLMNRLARENNGFPLGSTVQSGTKGIWMWCVPHPSKPDHTLVLLDTEGLGDVEKGDPENDSWIFALAVLLSSAFIYNSMSTIYNDALEQLHYVTKLTELIRAKSSPNSCGEEDATGFANFFPDFIWTVRDFTLELKVQGRPIKEDEYLEYALKSIPGEHPKVKNANKSRECIRHFFPERKCFVFDRPRNEKKLLACIENVLENQLNPKFRDQSNNFCSYIYTHARTKTLRHGVKVTGNRLGTLVVTYVDTINSGEVPCLENAVTTLAQRENSVAVQKAADHYSEQMAQRVKLPTDTLQELLDVHMGCETEAIAIFMDYSFKDDKQEFYKELLEIIKKKKEDFMLQNEEASANYCQTKLIDLSKVLMENIAAGTFCMPGGHKLYIEAKEMIEWEYWQIPRKGVKVNEVLQNFLQSQVVIETTILLSDKALTYRQETITVEWAKKEAAEKEQKLLRQKQKEQEKQMAAQERSLRENITQLKNKLESKRDNSLREIERLLDHMLMMQKDVLNEVFRNKFEEMNADISFLRKEIQTTTNDISPWISQTLDRLATEATSILSVPTNLVGYSLTDLHSLFK